MSRTRKLPRLVAAFILFAMSFANADSGTSLVVEHDFGPDTCTETLAKSGNHVYVARRHDGCAIVDISDPNNPVDVANVDPDPASQDIWDVQVLDDKLYLMNIGSAVDSNTGNWTGLYIYDVATPSSPQLLGTLTWGAGAWYHLAGQVRAGAVARFGSQSYVFLSSKITGQVEIFNVTTPSAPVYVTYLPRPGFSGEPQDVVIQGTQAYTAWMRDGWTIHDISTIGTPVELAHQVYTGPAVINGGTRTISPTPSGDHVVTGEYTTSGHVRLWRVDNLPTVTAKDTWQLPGAALLWTVRATDDFAYVAHLEDGVQVLDIRDEDDIFVAGCMDLDAATPTGTWAGAGDVELDGTDFCASHQSRGLLLGEFGDVVTITRARYKSSRKRLVIWATSTEQPDVDMYADGFGKLRWKANKNRYQLTIKNITSAPASVTVRSSLTGVDTQTVDVR